jgi:hypothetical protein
LPNSDVVEEQQMGGSPDYAMSYEISSLVMWKKLWISFAN